MPKQKTVSIKSIDWKSFLPYVLPVLSFILVAFMFIRWYKARTAEKPSDFLNSEAMQVQALPSDQQESLIKGTTDFETIALSSSSSATGEIRYQVKDSTLSFTLTANLPASEESYAVWLQTPGTESRRRVFTLTENKAGFVGSASISAEVLPVDVIVTKSSDLLLEDAVLTGNIPASLSEMSEE